jgi:hypothetical protein
MSKKVWAHIAQKLADVEGILKDVNLMAERNKLTLKYNFGYDSADIKESNDDYSDWNDSSCEVDDYDWNNSSC